MSATEPRIYQSLLDVLDDPAFPELDLSLRGGRHVGPEDLEEHALLSRAEELIASYYERYGCRLATTSEGVYFLVDEQGRLPRRTLTTAEMLVGQALALLRLSPEVMAEGGIIPEARLMEVLEQLITPEDRLVRLLVSGRRTGKYTAVDGQRAREAVATALTRLARLGFVDRVDQSLLPRRAIMRFTDPVRHQDDPRVGLSKLVAAGGVVVTAAEGATTDDDEDDDG